MDQSIPDGAWDEYDLLIARGFGLPDQAESESMARAWVRSHLGEPARIVSCALSVGAVWVLETPGRGRIVLKAWGANKSLRELEAQLRVQASFVAAGRPAPPLLTGALPFGAGHAVAMGWLDQGDIPDLRVDGVLETMARGLADFIGFAASLPHDPGLPRPDEAPAGEIWPKPHNALFDFQKTAAGAGWIDTAAAPALDMMRAARCPDTVGNIDWSAKNLRMRNGAIAAIYDWDAVVRWPETLIVGAAAANFPMQWDLPVPLVPTPAQMARFIAAYETERGSRFTGEQMEEVAASATYARAYTARCEHCWDPDRSRKWDDSSPRRVLWDLGAYTPGMLRNGA